MKKALSILLSILVVVSCITPTFIVSGAEETLTATDVSVDDIINAESLNEMADLFSSLQGDFSSFTEDDVLKVETQMGSLFMEQVIGTTEETDDYYLMINNMLEVRKYLGMCTCCSSTDDHASFCPQYTETSSYLPITPIDESETEEDDFVSSKTVANNGDNTYTITIEAYAKGKTVTTHSTKPADIVFVIDQSTSMLYGDSSGFKLFPGSTEAGTGGLTREYMNTDEAKKHGEYGLFYLAYGLNNVCFLTYRNDQWMYVDTGLTKSGTVHPNHTNLNGDYWNGVIDQVLTDWDAYDAMLQPMTETMWTRFVKYGIYPTRFGALHEALRDIVQSLTESGVNHRISVVGFGGQTQAGTELFVDGVGTSLTSGITVEQYQDSLVDVSVDKESVLNSVNALLPTASRTHHNGGIEIANGVFENNPVNLEERDRFLIFFSDGDRSGGGGDNDDLSYAQAYTAKQTHSAEFYSIGLATAPPELMSQLSSNYPTYDGTNTLTQESDKYYMHASNSSELLNAFSTISSTVDGTQVELDDSSYIHDIVTKYFTIPEGESSVRAYTVDCNGYVDDLPQWSDEKIQLGENCIIVEGNSVKVTGFDYTNYYVSSYGRIEGSTSSESGDFYGKKLVVEIDIVPQEGFIGGNAVVTNEPISGIYSSSGETVTELPVPETDVEIHEISAEISDANIYFGSEEAKNFTVTDLQDSAIVTVNGYTLDLSKHDEHYGLDWQDDYAHITVVILDENGNEVVGGFEDLREDTSYSIRVSVDPVYEGTETSVVTSNSAKISVFYPELTFKDSYHNYGDNVPTSSQMALNNWISAETKWKNADGVYSDTVTMNSDTVPELTLTYDLDYEGDTIGNDDIPVNVTVNSIGYVTDVQNLCYFNWEKCDPECEFKINSHYGDADSYEFYLHVNSVIESDSVVIDYGLPVKISILANDVNAKAGSVTAIGSTLAEGTKLNNVPYTSSQLVDGVTSGLVLANGTASMEDDKIVYTPTNLEMSQENVFYYEYLTEDGEYYYASITVIPATNIYYEESFFTFKDGDGYVWNTAGETLADKFQAEDRPGAFSFEGADADNVYGSDNAYDDSVTYSLGSSKYTSVDVNSPGKEPTAEFTFCGTGFDLFSVTNSNTGAVLVSIYRTDGKIYKNYIVQTYYGYSYEDDTFKPNPESTDSLYQVPVISARELGYDTYKVVIKPLYSSVFDTNYDATASAENNSYDIYVDSVRIYNPAGVNLDKESVIGNAYLHDGEYSPEYEEVRHHILETKEFYDKELEGTEFGKGSVFIDSIGSVDSSGISDKFLEAGPNNEVYLAKVRQLPSTSFLIHRLHLRVFSLV